MSIIQQAKPLSYIKAVEVIRNTQSSDIVLNSNKKLFGFVFRDEGEQNACGVLIGYKGNKMADISIHNYKGPVAEFKGKKLEKYLKRLDSVLESENYVKVNHNEELVVYLQHILFAFGCEWSGVGNNFLRDPKLPYHISISNPIQNKRKSISYSTSENSFTHVVTLDEFLTKLFLKTL